MPQDKKTLAWPSGAVADLLREIPEEIDPVITPGDWEKRPKILDLDHWDRSKFDREALRHLSILPILARRMNAGAVVA